jgi:tRNA threonylcarbamoyladenosine biosynthesis protein TsaB
LHALALGHGITPGVLCCLLHAGRGELYGGLFTWQQGGLTRLRPDTLLTPEAVVEFAGIGSEEEVHLIGEGVERYRDRLMTALGARARFTEDGLKAVPTAVAIARLGGQRLREGDPQSIEPVTPVYLRRAEAEVNWDKGMVKSPLERLAKTGH